MMYYIKIIFNFIIFNEFTMLLCMIFLLVNMSILFYRINKNYKVTFEDFIIFSIWPIIYKTILFLVLYIFLFMYLRLINIQRVVDLKIIIYNLSQFFMKNHIFFIFLKLLSLILCMILIINLITIIRKYFYYHFLQVHIYLMYWTREPSRYIRTKYEIFLEKVRDISLYPIFSFIFSRIYEIYTIRKQEYTKDSSDFILEMTNYLGYYEVQKYSHIYLLLFCLLYDIIYNNMVLNVVYYYGILYSLHYLLVATTRFATVFSKIGCLKIADYLIRRKKREQNNIIILPEQLYYYEETIEPYYHTQLTNAFNEKYHDYGIGKTYVENELFLLNVFFIFNIYFYYNIEIFVDFFNNVLQIQVSIQNILQVLIGILVISWLYFQKYIFKCILIILTMVVIILWLIISIHHFVPLLYNEIFINTNIEKFNIYLYIIDNYTINDKIYFIKEYAIYKLQTIHETDKEYLLSIIEKLPLQDLIEFSNIEELKVYVDNLIQTFIKMEKQYAVLFNNFKCDTQKSSNTISWNILDYIINTPKFISKVYESIYNVKYFIFKR
jgi:hypothetical protein